MYYDIVTWSKEVSMNSISEFRDLKIRILNGENLFKINKDKIKQHKDKLDFISDMLPGDIITGSLSLSLYGLLSRDIGDIVESVRIAMGGDKLINREANLDFLLKNK